VLNFSVSGYDTVQEVEFLEEKALRYDPDLVLVAYCLNDVKIASRELHLFSRDADWNSYRATADAAYRNAVLRSHLVRFVWHRIGGIEGQPDDLNPGSPTRGLGRTTAGFERLRSLADLSGFDVSVVVFPFFRDFDNYPFDTMHDAVAAEARRHGFDVLDLLPTYAEASRSTDLCSPCCDLHPNEAGHLETARAIAAHLTLRLPFPPN
jgi:lysophospholipase L1-like esterase